MGKDKNSELQTLEALYTKENVEKQRKRYQDAVSEYEAFFGGIGDNYRVFSSPGRTEVGGNHADHNQGKVLAASVNLDVIAIVEPTDTMKIELKSEGYEKSEINIDELSVVESEKNTAEALIRGVAAGFKKYGYKIGGFKAYTTTDVIKGSGLSSSASFEVLIGTILNKLYNDGQLDSVRIAQIGQYAENEFFGKPSGLMDQMACAVGGFVAIDFKEAKSPVIENINVKISDFRHVLCIVDTKGDHADLTADYASIPQEMNEIAEFFSCKHLRSLCRDDIILNIAVLREKFGDRAVLRSLHFFEENTRVDKLVHALKIGDFNAFLSSIKESGDSSYKYLQNIYSVNDIKHQGLGIGLNIADKALSRKGACRVHGGGFAGTIQAFVPYELLQSFIMDMEKVFGAGSCHVLTIRPFGGVEVERKEFS